MKRSFFEVKIATMIIAVVMVVFAAAYIAFQNLSYIADSIRKEARPDMSLVMLKDINSDILNVESNVKYYTLTGNHRYLNSYYDQITGINSKTEQLEKFINSKSNNSSQIDTFKMLLNGKQIIWKQMLLFRRDNRVDQAFNKLSEKLEMVTDTMTLNYKIFIPDTTTKVTSEIVDPEKKAGFFTRLFKRKNEPKADVAQKGQPAQVDKNIPVDSSIVKMMDTTLHVGIKKSLINQEINQIIQEEGIIKNELTIREFYVLSENERINLKLNRLIKRMENEEIRSIGLKAIEADKLADKTNKWIGASVIVASLVLLAVFFVIVNYVRKTNKYQHALVKAKNEAEMLSLAREQFVANMSHEIRTPMNALTGFTEQLLAMPLEGKQREQLTIVKKSADHLMRIINDILDFSKLEAGKLQLERIPFNPGLLLNEVYSLYKPSATAKKLSLKLLLSKDLHYQLYGDPFRLKQILFNLLSNAIKFTNSGTIEIVADLEKKDTHNANLIITINDTGIGIPENKHDKIFEEFTQAEMDITRQYGGTGLGLSIVKKLIKVHNGSLELKSKHGEGSSFTFSIPYNICSETQTVDITPETHSLLSVQESISVLVADDDEYNKMLIGHILDKHKINYKMAGNGKEVIEELAINHFDLILMDIRMPIMDGAETTKEIRNKLPFPVSEIPIIALTATLTADDEIRHKTLGMNAVISKPFSEDHLLQTISGIINRISPEEKTDKTYTPDNSEKPNEPDKELVIDIEKLNNLANNDKIFVREMLDMFVRTTQQGVIEIYSKSLEKDWNSVAELAHKILAPCKHIGADVLAHNLKKIEELARNGKNEELLADYINEVQSDTSIIIAYIQNTLEKDQ
jgi:signal transduction histidine kinase/CheY-like chemotaxis protein/CHASE3 domain sensor protein/HPt (histidine-containing phosphotransfer) domain-containing protein